MQKILIAYFSKLPNNLESYAQFPLRDCVFLESNLWK